VSPKIGVAMLARVCNHDREQDQSGRVAQERDASRASGHRGIPSGSRREENRLVAE
jgi:hypothetical protein